MRLVLTVAAVTAALAIPGLAGAGDPQLQFEVRPQAPVVLESGGRRDSLLTLDVRNPSDRPIRVDGIRIVYFEGATAVKTVEPATELFAAAGLLSDPRVEAGAADSWAGLCLAPPTAATDRVRLELALVQRRGLRTLHATQAVDIALTVPAHPAVIALPVRGKWRVTQGHTCDTSHRRSPLGSEFAWDLVAVDDPTRANGRARDGRPDGATFGRAVVAPIAGRVAFAIGNVADNDAIGEGPRKSYTAALRHPLWFFGNYVVIDAGGVFVLLAHLQNGSLAVKVGDVLREGDLVAYVGNSGNTTAAHLHVQVMNRADPSDPGATGIPALFRDYVEALTRGEGARREAVLRRVAAGDPPEGAVVFSASTEPSGSVGRSP